MDASEGVELHVLAQTSMDSEEYEELREYDNPDKNNVAEDAAEVRYIEAKTGRKFRLCYTLNKGFNFYSANVVSFDFDIDGGVLDASYTICKIDLECKGNILRRAKNTSIEQGYVKSDGKNTAICFTFASADAGKS